LAKFRAPLTSVEILTEAVIDEMMVEHFGFHVGRTKDDLVAGIRRDKREYGRWLLDHYKSDIVFLADKVKMYLEEQVQEFVRKET